MRDVKEDDRSFVEEIEEVTRFGKYRESVERQTT